MLTHTELSFLEPASYINLHPQQPAFCLKHTRILSMDHETDPAMLEYMARKQKRPSYMARKFQQLFAAEKLAAEKGAKGVSDEDIFKNYELPPPPKIWFFYGSLMDPSTLQSVLSLAERPTLRPANLPGYHLKMWGQYPALIDARPMLTVPGMVFEADEHDRSEDILAKLQAYEGDNYKYRTCLVEIVGQEGEDVEASTFQWCGDTAELKEGSFDLKDYQMSKLEKEVE